jgi:hypothetical protein
MLADFSRMGRVVPELQQENIREILLLSYRIIYRVNNDEVDILTIHHGARFSQASTCSNRTRNYRDDTSAAARTDWMISS